MTVTTEAETEADPGAFSLHALITECVEESPTRDPEIIAKAVLDRIPEAQYRDILLALLRPAVRSVYSSQRSRGFAGQEVDPAGEPRRTGKVEAIQAVARLLAATVNVGGSNYKAFGECTEADLLTATQIMRQLAASHAQRANTYEQYVGLLRKHRAKTVGKLPENVLAQMAGAQ